MSIIGGALGAVGSIFGGLAASKAMRQVKKDIEAQRKRNEDWFNRSYNEDATQRADVQQQITRVEEALKNRNKSLAGRSAVMGGDDASVAEEKARNAQALSGAISDIAAKGDARKDNIEAVYMQNDNAYSEQLNQLETNKAQAISGAVQGLATAASQMPF